MIRLTPVLIAVSLSVTACGRAPSLPPVAGEPCASSPSLLRGGPVAHAHNDYEHDRPLEDALARGFRSVEVDIHQRGDDLVVSHIGLFVHGTLRELYLDPLQRRMRDRGSVFGDGRPFTLWIDLKGGGDRMRDALVALLWRYSMLADASAPMTVILTGDRAKASWVSLLPPRARHRDANAMTTPARPELKGDRYWTHYALEYRRYFSWDGDGAIPAVERAALRCMVRRAHEAGRPIRLYATPETADFWRVAEEEGVDYLHVDDFDAFARFRSALGPSDDHPRVDPVLGAVSRGPR
ncbi:MAG: hypothetical protein AAGA56_09905 [Myxococcota bacterium]